MARPLADAAHLHQIGRKRVRLLQRVAQRTRLRQRFAHLVVKIGMRVLLIRLFQGFHARVQRHARPQHEGNFRTEAAQFNGRQTAILACHVCILSFQIFIRNPAFFESSAIQ